MPKYDKYHAKWKANMAKCSKHHAKCKVTMPKCSKYHAKWQVLVPNCCKYKANGTGKENQKKFQNLRPKKIKKLFYTFIISFGVGFHVVPQFDHSTGRSHWFMFRFDPDQLWNKIWNQGIRSCEVKLVKRWKCFLLLTLWCVVIQQFNPAPSAPPAQDSSDSSSRSRSRRRSRRRRRHGTVPRLNRAGECWERPGSDVRLTWKLEPLFSVFTFGTKGPYFFFSQPLVS